MLSAIMVWGLLLASGLPAVAAAESIQGRLAQPVEGRPLQLIAADGSTVELAVDEFLERTMRDPPLAGRTWEALGRKTADGRFEVDRAFTIKNGRRHRVTFYCEICHITTYEPGRCMCCQEMTELREIPEE